MAEFTQRCTKADDGFHEIQLAGSSSSSCSWRRPSSRSSIFLCGVLVGRGVRIASASATDEASLAGAPAPTDTVAGTRSPPPSRRVRRLQIRPLQYRTPRGCQTAHRDAEVSIRAIQSGAQAQA